MKYVVSYIPYAKYSKEHTGNITTFAQFVDLNLLSETRNGTKSSNTYNEYSTIPPLTNEAEMDVN